MSHVELRLSEETMRRNFLVQTPTGSSFDNVLRKLRAEGYTALPANHGVFRLDAEEHSSEFGASSIQVSLGTYWMLPFFSTDVMALWAFGSDGRLLDVWVWKTTDGP